MQFQVEPVELTVQAVVTTEANGKIGWKIFELGGSYESEATQTVTLRLAPVWRNPDGTVVSDFSIAAVRPEGDLFGPHE